MPQLVSGPASGGGFFAGPHAASRADAATPSRIRGTIDRRVYNIRARVGRRPNFNNAVKALIRDVAKVMAEFQHIRPSRIMIVAGEARRASRGTVKPLAFAGAQPLDRRGRKKPLVRLKGRRMLYCITLRPLFFRASTPRSRIATLLHELFHISK